MASKLHLYNITGGPFCGRQLSNHRALRAQNATSATITLDHGTFLEALRAKHGCRWCAAKAGLAPKAERVSWRDQIEEGEDDE